MRIFELTREAVAPAKPLPILPQGAQTPPPPLTDKDVAPNKSPMSGKNPQLQVPAANPAPAPAPAAATAKPAAPAAATAKPAAPAAATAKPAAPAASGATNAASLRANMNAAASGKPGTTAPAPAAGNPAAFGGGVVNPPSKSGVVSKADLDTYRTQSGNPTATLGQYMNQQQGLTARKGGANDPAVIAAKQQPAGPAVGSQAQTAGGKNELAKFNIAANKPPAAAAPAAAAPAAAAPNPNSGSAYTGGVGKADNNPVPAAEPAPAATPTAAAPTSGGLRGNFSTVSDGGQSASAAPASGGLRGNFSTVSDGGQSASAAPATGQAAQPAPTAAPPAAGAPVGGTTNAVTRTDAEIGDTNTRTGVVTPGSFDKNAAQGQKNLDSVKNFLGFNKPAAPAAGPGNAAALIPPANPAPLRGVKESARVQDPVLVRMQNLAGIRR